MKVPCALCGQGVETTAIGTYRKTTGWAPLRAQGEANVIRLAEPHDEWAHQYCVGQEARGISVKQGTLA